MSAMSDSSSLCRRNYRPGWLFVHEYGCMAASETRPEPPHQINEAQWQRQSDNLSRPFSGVQC
jgi:hypothetical protein